MARNPPQGGNAPPPPDPDAGSDVDEHDQGDAGDDPTGERESQSRPRSGGGRGGRLADDGAGWVLGLLLWGWLVLPFLKGGPARVKQTLMAKFLNKAPDGSWLP